MDNLLFDYLVIGVVFACIIFFTEVSGWLGGPPLTETYRGAALMAVLGGIVWLPLVFYAIFLRVIQPIIWSLFAAWDRHRSKAPQKRA